MDLDRIKEIYEQNAYIKLDDIVDIVREDKYFKSYSKKEIKNLLIQLKNEDSARNITQKDDPEQFKHFYSTEPYAGYYMIDLVNFTGGKDTFVFMAIHVVSRKIWLEETISSSKATIGTKDEDAVFNAFLKFYYNGYKPTGNEEEDKNHALFVSVILSDKEPSFGKTTLLGQFCAAHHITQVYKDKDEHRIMGVLDSTVRKLKNNFYQRISRSRFGNLEVTSRNVFNFLLSKIKEVEKWNNETPRECNFRFTPNEVFVDEKLQNELYEYYHLLNQYKESVDNKTFKVGDEVKLWERTKAFMKTKKWLDPVYVVMKKNKNSYELAAFNKKEQEIEDEAVDGKKFKPYELKLNSGPRTYLTLNLDKINRMLAQAKHVRKRNYDGDYGDKEQKIIKEVVKKNARSKPTH